MSPRQYFLISSGVGVTIKHVKNENYSVRFTHTHTLSSTTPSDQMDVLKNIFNSCIIEMNMG